MANNKITRMPELDIMKFIGIILVVVGHVARMYTSQGLIQSIGQNCVLSLITDVIYSFHMPMFVFVSGMTLAFVSVRKPSYQVFWLLVVNKTKRLMIPYFAFGLLWVLPFMVGFGFRDFRSYLLNGIILSLDSRHLWYVWMLFDTFVLFYILRLVSEKLKFPQYSVMIASMLLYIIEKCWGGRIPYFQIDNMLEYQLWFILGYMTLVYKSEFKRFIPIVLVIGVASTFFYVPITRSVYALIGTYLTYWFAQAIRNIAENKIIKSIVKNSFGIYLFHPIIIYALYYYYGDSQHNVYLFASCVSIISFLISYLLTEAMRKAKLQVLIGEK